MKSTFASDDPCSNNARNIGVAAGVAIGALLGKQLGDGHGKSVVVGATLGALAGGLIGADMDRRRCELFKLAKAHNLDIAMTDITMSPPGPAGSGASPTASQAAGASSAVSPAQQTQTVGMSFTVFDNGKQFPSGSAAPSEAAQRAFADFAEKYRTIGTGGDAKAVQEAKDRARKMRILLVGHTDDAGPSQLNADLSEERARAIAGIFARHGFDASQIYFQGAGEVFPIADNRTEDGRSRNRRVEIVDLSDDAAFNAFLSSRRPNLANYRPVTPTADARIRTATNATSSKPVDKVPAKPLVAKPSTTLASKGDTVTRTIAKTSPATVAAGGGNARGAASVADSSFDLDFGGKPVNNGQFKAVDIGKPLKVSSFSIISSAYAADDTPLGSCASDRPRISNRVKSLSTGQSLKTSDYLPGTASASWSGMVNRHMVGMSGVAVLRDGATPVGRPNFYVWKNWVDGSKAIPETKTTAEVNAYQGDRALLYRVFPVEGPVRCIDLVIPNGAPSTAPSSTLVYSYAKTLYQADYAAAIPR